MNIISRERVRDHRMRKAIFMTSKKQSNAIAKRQKPIRTCNKRLLTANVYYLCEISSLADGA